MHEYCGLKNDIIIPAGRFPKENGWGGECWNFKKYGGRMYGYARVNRNGDPGPVVRRLNSDVADRVDDVTVVWVAHNGSIDETKVVGWFKEATVYSSFRDRPDAKRIADQVRMAGIDIEVGQEELKFFVTCKAENARLLREGERKFPVPIGKGWMSTQFLLFYPDGGKPADRSAKRKHVRFKDRVLDYIAACTDNGPATATPYARTVEPVDGRLSVEGEQVRVTHVARERDPRLIKRAKRKFKKAHDRLYCVACGFDFQARYGSLGEDFIEAHHVIPLSEGPRRVSPDDLMMLCANCHRMVHRQMNRVKRNLTRDESLMSLKQRGS